MNLKLIRDHHHHHHHYHHQQQHTPAWRTAIFILSNPVLLLPIISVPALADPDMKTHSSLQNTMPCKHCEYILASWQCFRLCLQSILNVRWWHKKSHTEIRHLAKIDSAEHLLLQRQLRWLGHVIRMPSNRLPRRLLYGELLSGQRPVGRPKLRYSDHISRCSGNATSLNPTLRTLQLIENHGDTCAAGLKNLPAASEQVASDRRARRHAASQATPAGPACPQYGRICASDFGLRSHLRSHRRPQNWHSSSTTSWSKSTDYHKQASKQDF